MDLIERHGYEMMELTEDGAGVRVYFSNPPIKEQYKKILHAQERFLPNFTQTDTQKR